MRDKIRTGYCATCGEKRRLTYDRIFCTMRCAASTMSTLVSTGGYDVYCTECGQDGVCICVEEKPSARICDDCMNEVEFEDDEWCSWCRERRA